jgi:hypothetical protein
MLTAVLDNRLQNVTDNLETLSTDFKKWRTRTELNFKDIPEQGRNSGQAKAEYNLFKVREINNMSFDFIYCG